MAATLKDIANEVGLSQTAVSQVLNNKPCRISLEKRKLIQETAKKLNYFPNSSAVALVTRKTNNIGVVVFDIANPFFANLAKGIDDAVSVNDYRLVLVNMSTSGQSRKNYSNYIGLNGTDGLILTADIDEPGITEFLLEYAKSNRPVICVGTETIDAISEKININNISTADFNNERGGYLATNHLIVNGHKKIACITGPNGTPGRRLDGYKRALKENGIDFDPKFVKYGDYHQKSGYEKAIELYEAGVRAFFVFNDLMAYGIYHMAADKGLIIGKDLSVVGFDNLEYSSLLSVPLTSVDQPAYDIGVGTGNLLIELLKTPNNKRRAINFEPQLIIRSSVCKLK